MGIMDIRDWHDTRMQSQSWMWTGRQLGPVCNGWGWLLAQSSSCSDSDCVQVGSPRQGLCLHSQNGGGSSLRGQKQTHYWTLIIKHAPATMLIKLDNLLTSLSPVISAVWRNKRLRQQYLKNIYRGSCRQAGSPRPQNFQILSCR